MSKKKIESKKLYKDFFLSDTAKQIINEYEHRQYPPNFVSGFKTPDVPPSILAKDGEKLTMDSLPINQCNFGPFDKINKTLLNSRFLGYPEYSLLSQNGIIQRIIQVISRDCVREWITIYSKKTNSSNGNEKIAAIEDEMKRLGVRDKIRECVEMMVTFGGCKLYPKILGDDAKDEYLTPLRLEKVPKNGLLYLKPIEPLYATPGNFNAVDPLAEDYYVPSEWRILNNTMHHSRLGHFRYNDIPTLLKPIYWFNGMPLVQLCLDYLWGFETVRQNIVGISGRYNINIFKTNMAALLNYKDGSSFQSGEDVLSRMKLAQALQNNYSIFALDNNPTAPEEWQQFNMTMAGLVEILNENAGYLCALTGIPESVLFMKKSKGGLGRSDDNEIRLYYDNIGSFQDVNVKHILDWVLQLIQMSLFGKVDPDLDFKFNPLWKQTPKEIWEIQKIKSDINTQYFADGILEGNEIRESISKDPDSGYAGLSDSPKEDFEDSEAEKDSLNEAA
jgi:phage-related protein (TIGR01555 family)